MTAVAVICFIMERMSKTMEVPGKSLFDVLSADRFMKVVKLGFEFTARRVDGAGTGREKTQESSRRGEGIRIECR
jgi:hypothetical protein